MQMNVAEAKSKLSELLAAVDAPCAPSVKEPDKHRPPLPRGPKSSEPGHHALPPTRRSF